ncbi:ArsR/SmtB family transcription factor [Desmospora activa]|uniref:ArsR family transcriptional regulator n=1 Tax=Desmospora activa DSM 45169 TaxID=1121389 RepID=A0A2T4Z811_9BACL|nr:winged helix-turn-helix domain-containing protein [Desmospora activa]PTM58005.1 ArsR family transcriptional regulator [Desmospora activa DSM 45169]
MIHAKLPEIARLFSDPSRVSMLTVLLDGRFHTAGELAYQAGITPQTASFHLQKLQSWDLLECDHQGRHRYYRLTSNELAQWMESFLGATPSPEIRSLRQSTQLKKLKKARTCYDHLAGECGVKLLEGLLDQKWLTEAEEKKLVLTETGKIKLIASGIDVNKALKKRRSFAHQCLDWSERRYHLAGALGSEILHFLLRKKWLIQSDASRALRLSDDGKESITYWLGVRWE